MIDVCICTHNPRPEILAKVLASIRDQTVIAGTFRFLIVDNASSPPLDESLLTSFTQLGITARMVREPVLGIARARLRAITETDGEMLLFVDDDNELMPNYIAEGMQFSEAHKDVGGFGGKLLLPPNLCPAKWVKPFLPYLAIKDVGEEPVFGKSASWGNWEPPTAGAFIKRPVLMLYQQRVDNDPNIFKLGRKGTLSLSSCEDAFIMSGSFTLGLRNAYYPKLVLYHHLDAKRFHFKYLLRLMYAYGVSHEILKSLRADPESISDPHSFWKQFFRLLRELSGAAKKSLRFGISMAAYRLGALSERLRLILNK